MEYYQDMAVHLNCQAVKGEQYSKKPKWPMATLVELLISAFQVGEFADMTILAKSNCYDY